MLDTHVHRMPDLIGQLPASLPLSILLQLCDLKSLYAAVLSSPRLLAAFQRSAHLVFQTIVRRTMSDEQIKLILSYMCASRSQRNKGHGKTNTEVRFDSSASNDDELDAELTAMPSTIIFHTVAQAVRIDDLAFHLLRSKLDYLPTLHYEKLADPKFRFVPNIPMSRQMPEGTNLAVPSRLRDPSWIEQSRAMRALWLLATRCRTPQNLEPADILASEEFPCTEVPWINKEVVKIALSLVSGPTLLPPSQSQGRVQDAYSGTLLPWRQCLDWTAGDDIVLPSRFGKLAGFCEFLRGWVAR
jgi:hypothetical protein